MGVFSFLFLKGKVVEKVCLYRTLLRPHTVSPVFTFVLDSMVSNFTI